MRNEPDQTQDIKQIAEALSVVNRHAKAAPDPRHLYSIKQKAIHKLLKDKHAKKIGLHFSNHPKRSQQHSTLLIQVDEYYFHLPPNKEDLKELKHLGSLDDSYRNPKPQLNLRRAKQILYQYLGYKPEEENRGYAYNNRKPSYNKSISSWVSGNSKYRDRFYKEFS
ncbi:YkyB family protein [Salirhabdus sp. Marseille-P4669]|uniref:YkyB family protein n=1 Tax=Salirhabdus sp. Marseille-P4669 TaxID=2042310 RepID=UPI000C79FE0C|nr:YkyB family protein [Salirhabdus sp. Marseille-P4669]